MPKIKEFTVGLTRKINLGNYESVDISCGVTLVPEDGEDVDELVHRAWDMVRTNIKEQAFKYTKKETLGQYLSLKEAGDVADSA